MRRVSVLLIAALFTVVLFAPLNTATALDLTPTESHADSVVEAWVQDYADPDSGNWIADIAVDGVGDIVVTGISWEDVQHDYVTVKYGPDGAWKWWVRYDGPIHSFDEPVALAIDSENNICVTGWGGTPNLDDFITVKYDANGIEHWVVFLDHSGLNDQAVAVAVDDTGNVYVTGWGQELDVPEARIHTNIVTVKYTNNGQEVWSASYDSPDHMDDSPVGIGVDMYGHVYVGGHTHRPFEGQYGDYVTIMYDADGTERWVRVYDGPISGDDVASALAVDACGYAYITGYVDDTPATSDYDACTIKYDTTGTAVWVARYDRSGGWDDPNAITLGDEGYVYVTGSSSPDDFTTLKYDSTGQLQWASFYDLPDNSTDYAYDIAVDPSGNVYVTGDGWAPGGNDLATVKYGPDGVQKWHIIHPGPDNWNVWATGLALDDSANVYVAATVSNLAGPGAAMRTIKYTQIPETPAWDPNDCAPARLRLVSCAPNPFSHLTTVSYSVAAPERVSLRVVNVAGQEVARLTPAVHSAGRHTLSWEPVTLPGGTYLLRLQTGTSEATAKVVFVK